jgi:hypothetical protein
MSTPPTMQEELDRKVSEEVENAFLAVRAGKLTSYGYQMALEGLWAGVSGLASNDASELMTAAMKEFPAGKTETMRKVTIVGENVFVVKWEVGSAKVETTVKMPGKPAAIIASIDPEGSAANALRTFLVTTKKFRDMPGAQAI